MIPEGQNDLCGIEIPKKKIKTDSTLQNMQGQQLYPERQRNMLRVFLNSLKEYPKITAVMIEHQHKSINTLPTSIKQKFSQLTQRVSRCIDCCKKNAQLLQRVKSTLQTELQLNTSFINGTQNVSHQCQGQLQHTHSHSHSQTNPNKILSIFNHLCRQYSSQQIHKNQRFYIEFVKETIHQFITNNIQSRDNVKALVVGSGMGRTLAQLKDLFQSLKLQEQSYLIQGHEQDPEYYLMAQYLLNHAPSNEQQIKIYPYIHNFSNLLFESTPYTPVTINLPKSFTDKKCGMTFGQFNKLYRSHTDQWTVVVTQFHNYSVTDVLLYIQIIYKMLKNKGIWIDISTASFENHLVPYLSYQQYERILDKSQFKLMNKFNRNQFWYQQPDKLMNQWRKVYYRVMTKIQ